MSWTNLDFSLFWFFDSLVPGSWCLQNHHCFYGGYSAQWRGSGFGARRCDLERRGDLYHWHLHRRAARDGGRGVTGQPWVQWVPGRFRVQPVGYPRHPRFPPLLLLGVELSTEDSALSAWAVTVHTLSAAHLPARYLVMYFLLKKKGEGEEWLFNQSTFKLGHRKSWKYFSFILIISLVSISNLRALLFSHPWCFRIDMPPVPEGGVVRGRAGPHAAGGQAGLPLVAYLFPPTSCEVM